MIGKAVNFEKYHGAGNDFIVILSEKYFENPFSENQIRMMCDRHLGIGADGLIVINDCDDADFEMVYYNADGLLGTMCGNGGRVAVTAAVHHQIVNQSNSITFRSGNTIHHALIHTSDQHGALISLHLNASGKISSPLPEMYLIDTGSPHLVVFVDDCEKIDVFVEGKKLRNHRQFQPSGVNVNFIAGWKDGIYVRTFERGVENETLSCGTGVTASSVVWAMLKGISGVFTLPVYTKGGNLTVSADMRVDYAEDCVLTGPALRVFSGILFTTEG